MTPPVSLPTRTPVRVFIALCAPAFALALALALVLALALALLAPSRALAFEERAFGDLTVRDGEVRSEVAGGMGDVTVEDGGSVAGDVHSGMGDVEVDGRVGGNLQAGFGDVEVDGAVRGDVDAGMGNVSIAGTVGGDMHLGRGDVEFGPGARVAGDLECGSCEIEGNRDAVQGALKLGGMRPGPDGFSGGPGPFGVLGLVGWFFGTLAFVSCAVLAAVLAPGPLSAAARRVEEVPWRSFIFGVASLPAALALFAALAISVVGIPLVPLLAPAYLALVFFGALVAAYVVGRRVVIATGRYHVGDALAATAGAGIVAATVLVPLLGGLLLFALVSLGTGATVLALLSRRRPGVGPAGPAATSASYEDFVRDRRGA